MKNIAVFFGGKSCEHDISVITGVLTLNSIDKTKFNAIPIYVDLDGCWYTGKTLNDVAIYKNLQLKKLIKVTFVSGSNVLRRVKKNVLKNLYTVDCAINCIHGLNGEDGSLAGLLKLCSVPCCSPSTFASSFSMDKDFTKIVLSGLNVEKLPYVRIHKSCFYQKRNTAIKMIEKKFKYPVIVKPANLGSSIGISTAKNAEELENALITAFNYDVKVIVEKALVGFKEINCSAYKKDENIIVSMCEEPVLASEILTFKDKYLGGKGGINKKFPADIPPEISSKIQSITEKIYRKCDFLGVIRIDFLVANGKVYVNEINTVPGSLSYYLHCKTLKEFTSLLTSLIGEGIKAFNEENSRNYVFNSSVLNQDCLNNTKGKML